MSVTPTTFRQQFREFMQPDDYPDDAINLWNTTALMFLTGSVIADNTTRWGTALDYATSLFIAHHLVLGARNLATAQAGGIPGEVKGPATNKSVDKVSQGYDTKAVTFEDGSAAFWNQTSYGVRLYDLITMFGAGGVQVGVTSPPGLMFGPQV